MSKGSFRRALADADRELASIRLPAVRDRKIRGAFGARTRNGWWLPALSAIGAAALVIAVFVTARSRAEDSLVSFQPVPPAPGWRVDHGEVEVTAPALAIDAPGFGRITATRGARLVRVAGGVRVVHGHVEFQITHRTARPALVHVSHGTIAVLGTRFVVDQTEGGGRVVLHEGKIRFASGARSIELAPGDSLTWPLAEPPSPPAPPPLKHGLTTKSPVVEDAPATQPAPAFDVDKLIAELAALRARGLYADAATLLERALTEPLPAATIERLSYELGAIETYQLARKDRACRHWGVHRVRFPQGRYGDEIEAALRRLGCKEIP